MSCWYTQNAPENDVVISTRVRLARNLSGVPFPSRMTSTQRTEVNERIKRAISESNTPFARSLKYIAMKDVPEIERYSMVERHIISREFASNCEDGAIILSEDETISVMIGEEDHIRIQVILGGLQLEKAYDIAESIDALLCGTLDLAFDERLGFLTECPTNLGTGLRASVMLHLPVTESTGEISALADSINKIGFTVRGMYGEGSKAVASIYQISNQITLGISEKNAIDNLKIITTQLIDKERSLRGQIEPINAEDLSMRAMGILQNARILSSEEMMKRLGEIKLGIGLGIIEDVLPIKLLIEGQPYMLMRTYGEMSPQERDIRRAEMVRNSLKE
ncbi:MAG: protein arginine kinase [Acutalibacteraceae bacterium]|nr:protein arginine kinase [Acutalibacteraceae bacterium]